MKISDIRGEQAVEVLADIIEPFIKICKHEEMQKAANSKNPVEMARTMMRVDPDAVLEILAVCEQVPVEEYNPNPFEIMKGLVDIFTDPAMQTVFFSQGPKAE